MKRTSILKIVFIASLVLPAGCDVKDPVFDASYPDAPVCFTATVGTQVVATPATRAVDTRWEAGDAIGLFMTHHGTGNIAEGASNRRYVTTDGTGNFTPATPADAIYYPMDGTTVDFVAFHPWQNDMKWDRQVFSLPDAYPAGTALFDPLWAKADNNGAGYSRKTAGPVTLRFHHCMAKLTINCKSGLGVGAIDPADMTVSIKNTPAQAILYPQTGIVEPGTETKDIHPLQLDAPSSAGYFATYAVTTPPATYINGQVQVDFEVGSKVFTWEVDAITFENGKEYVYNVTITHTGVRVTGTIIDWTIIDKGEIDAQ